MFLLHLIHHHLTDPEVYFQQENIDVKLTTAFAEFSIIDISATHATQLTNFPAHVNYASWDVDVLVVALQ